MQTSYIRVIYAKGKLFLLGLLAILTIFTAFYQVAVYLLQKIQVKTDNTVIFQLKKIFSPAPANNKEVAKPFTQEEEEKIIAEVKALPIEEVQQQLLKNAPDELKNLIEEGKISEEMMKELLIVLRETGK